MENSTVTLPDTRILLKGALVGHNAHAKYLKRMKDLCKVSLAHKTKLTAEILTERGVPEVRQERILKRWGKWYNNVGQYLTKSQIRRAPFSPWLATRLQNTYCHQLRPEARAVNIAYGFLRGRAYATIESKAKQAPDWTRIQKLMEDHSCCDSLPPDQATKVKKQISDWLMEASTHFRANQIKRVSVKQALENASGNSPVTPSRESKALDETPVG